MNEERMIVKKIKKKEKQINKKDGVKQRQERQREKYQSVN